MSEKSYSQKKREKYPYREKYFKHNPGLFGCIWVCAYCHRPLVGKDNVVVDHIVPLNSVLGRNARYNLVASCNTCNLKKSDKIDTRIAKGYISKIIESAVFTLQRLVVITLAAYMYIASVMWKALVGAVQEAFRMIPFTVKCIAVTAIVLLFLLK